MRVYKIYLLRHGLTQGNIEGRYVGKTDIDVCEQGKAEIIKYAEEFEYPTVGKVYSSPLLRCKTTAKLIYPEHEIVDIPNLTEYDFGDFENKTPLELGDREDFAQWLDGKMTLSPPNGEDMKDFNMRVAMGFDEVVMDMMKKNVSQAAIVVHGGVMMSLLTSCGLPKREPLKWIVGNGQGYSVLVNASLWSNTKTFEVCDKLPYGIKQVHDDKFKKIIDVK